MQTKKQQIPHKVPMRKCIVSQTMFPNGYRRFSPATINTVTRITMLLSLVREDRDGPTSGVPVVPPGAPLVGYVGK